MDENTWENYENMGLTLINCFCFPYSLLICSVGRVASSDVWVQGCQDVSLVTKGFSRACVA